jgi:hypothetical protein
MSHRERMRVRMRRAFSGSVVSPGHRAHPRFADSERGRADLREHSARRQGRRPDSACRRRAASLPARPKASHLRGVPKSALVNASAHTQATLQKAVTAQGTGAHRTRTHPRTRVRVFTRVLTLCRWGAMRRQRCRHSRLSGAFLFGQEKQVIIESCSASTRAVVVQTLSLSGA